MKTRSNPSRVTRTGAALALWMLAAIAQGCAGLRIGDPDAFAPVPLNRVYPYPTESERAGQKIEVVLAAQYSDTLPKTKVGPGMVALLAGVEQYLAAAGAGVIDRSIHDLASVRDELEAAESGLGTGGFTGADWAVVARMDKFRHWTEYSPPTSLFKNEEELQEDPGTCKHYGEVEARLRAFEIPTDDVARATWVVRHTDMFEEPEFDQSCPIEETRRMIFLEDIVKETLPCLEAPLKNGFAPIGFIEEHRVKAEAGLHIYRTSMGKLNGAAPGLELRIYRVQYMTTRDDERIRDERLIGEGVLSDQIGKHHSWMVADPADMTQQILEGDLVRAVYEDREQSTLGLGLCKRALTVQGSPR